MCSRLGIYTIKAFKQFRRLPEAEPLQEVDSDEEIALELPSEYLPQISTSRNPHATQSALYHSQTTMRAPQEDKGDDEDQQIMAANQRRERLLTELRKKGTSPFKSPTRDSPTIRKRYMGAVFEQGDPGLYRPNIQASKGHIQNLRFQYRDPSVPRVHIYRVPPCLI